MNKTTEEKRQTETGLNISASQVRRLEREVANLKDEYDSLKIKQLTMQGLDNDPAKNKTE